MIATVMGDEGTVRASPALARNLVCTLAQVPSPIRSPINNSPTTFATHTYSNLIIPKIVS